MTTSEQIMAALIIGIVCTILAGIAVAVLSRHERRQRETWRDEPYEGRHVLDEE